MSDFAAADYELSATEIKEWLDEWRKETPGHGEMRIVPTLEPHIWRLDGIYFSNRRVMEDGTVSFSWLIPEHPCPHEGTDLA
jgi:hypothetical protein